MADTLTVKQRSALMSRVRREGTTPEIAVRDLLSSEGVRYRLHDRKLAGVPDIVVPKSNAAVFVHGCFWHGHKCRKSKLPKSNRKFWATKIARNAQRDRANRRALQKAGWNVLWIWECETRRPDKLGKRLLRRLEQFRLKTANNSGKALR